jgi:hypothetical protein
MPLLNLGAVCRWSLLGVFVILLMSFQDPFRIALAGFLLSVHGPLWRGLHDLTPAPAAAPRRVVR